MKRCMRLGGYFVASTLAFMLIICVTFAVTYGMQLFAMYTAALIGGTTITEFVIYMLMVCFIAAGVITFFDRDRICKDS